MLQFGAAERVPRRGHRDPASRQPDRVRHRLAGSVVCPVPTQLRTRQHTQGPGRAAGPRTDQDHCECKAHAQTQTHQETRQEEAPKTFLVGGAH